MALGMKGIAKSEAVGYGFYSHGGNSISITTMEETKEESQNPVPPQASPLDPMPSEAEGWSELTPALPPVGILAGLSDQSLENLAPYGKYHNFNAGAEVIREGGPQDRLYIVVLGKLAITALVDGREVSLNETSEGECIGEISLLSPGPATASARAISKTTLWSIDATISAPTSAITWAARARCCSAWRRASASACVMPMH